jgi:putative restriction endonuclease
MPTPDDRAFWLRKIGKLAVDKASGDAAPHKPLLLLVVCELAELGVLENEFLILNGELAFHFAGSWSVVASRRSQRPDVRMPFYHLKREGFWQPLDAENRPAVDKKLTTLAHFDTGFRTCLEEPEFRRQVRLLLITSYFRH